MPGRQPPIPGPLWLVARFPAPLTGRAYTPGMPRLHTKAVTAGLLLALLGGATACSGGGDDEAPAGKPQRLKKVWSVEYPGAPQEVPEQVWRVPGILAFPMGGHGASLVGLDTSSGEQRWQLPAPKGTRGFCALSEQVNDKGIGGALLKDDEGQCAVAAAVDVRRGKVLWTEPLSEPAAPSSNGPGVSVGDRTLTATVSWREVVRFRLEGEEKGRKLGALPGVAEKGDKAPTGADHDGRHILLRVGDALVLYDADKGTRLWRHRVPGNSHLDGGLVSADPVVLDAAENGRRYYRDYGAGRVLGREMGRAKREDPVTGRGVLVARFDNDPRVRAYDMRSGKQLWARAYSPHERLEGTRGGALLSAHEYSGQETWLRTRDLRTGSPRVLGRLTGTASQAPLLAWDSRRLYAKVTTADGAERLVAYALPERGSARRFEAPPEQPGAPTVSDSSSEAGNAG